MYPRGTSISAWKSLKPPGSLIPCPDDLQHVGTVGRLKNGNNGYGDIGTAETSDTCHKSWSIGLNNLWCDKNDYAHDLEFSRGASGGVRMLEYSECCHTATLHLTLGSVCPSLGVMSASMTLRVTKAVNSSTWWDNTLPCMRTHASIWAKSIVFILSHKTINLAQPSHKSTASQPHKKIQPNR